ncbi:hypothetical protein L1987_42635 [Smallanthus sonchifolius]|uniref:Uncharacterized protein n=1 Tax=Smallanthus sonchifolius TaxID=185202 RepID=A0ACB9GKM9_9ASTR|nr:hypothetical protein L1987_42635 [Smallanthus sonchifolius]
MLFSSCLQSSDSPLHYFPKFNPHFISPKNHSSNTTLKFLHSPDHNQSNSKVIVTIQPVDLYFALISSLFRPIYRVCSSKIVN